MMPILSSYQSNRISSSLFLYLKGISFSFSQGRKKLKVLGKFQAISLVHAVVNVKTRGFPNLYLQQK
jgi:hypothetical protein